MAKIEHDKYYTPQHIVDLVIQRTKEVIGLENISEFIEPSAGNGAFLDKLYATGIPTKAYDLYPERDDIIEQDYLKLEMEYKKNRVIIGNPPFGRANSLIKKFYKKSAELGDYIVFILPISQYENNNELYDFDLIYSENLGLKDYSDRKIHCCFNIYKRPTNKKNKPKQTYSDLKIVGWRKSKETKCDFYICCYGSSCGSFVEQNSNLVNINGFIINNISLKDRIINILKNTKWKDIYPMTTTPNLLQWQVYKYLKEQIPELK